MKKTLLLMMSCMVALFANAQELTPIITLTAEVDGAERDFELGNAVEGENKISVDWGDGNIVEVATTTGIYDGWDFPAIAVKGTPKGKGEIKIYTTGDICYFDCSSVVNGPGYTSLDVSNATELTELYAHANELTSFDGSMLTKLKTLYLNNNNLTNESVKLPTTSLATLQIKDNQLTSWNGAEFTVLATLHLSGNNLGTLDVSNMPALKAIYANDCSLTSFKAGAMANAKTTISVNNNLLETLDVSEAIDMDGCSLYASNNNLTEIKYPKEQDYQYTWFKVENNKFTFATVPVAKTKKASNFVNAPQKDMEIEVVDGTIDLSSQKSVVVGEEAKATVYTWYTEDGTALVEGTDYTEEAGVFTFIAPQEQKVYCTMTTEALPKFTGANIFKTVAVSIEDETTGIESIEAAELVGDIYTVDGKLIKRNASVAAMQKGLYIVKTAAGETVKVICE